MPPGIWSAPEEFQRIIDVAVKGSGGTRAIYDDILGYGFGNTDE